MLRLRRFEKEDAGEIVTWIKDEVSFRKWSADLFDHYPITANDLQENYDNAIRVMKDRFIPLVAQDDDGIVGQLFIRFPDEEKRIGRFGFVIVDDKKRGMGYGKQMLELALEYAFDELKASKVTLGVFENNAPAYYCYKAAGFEEVVIGETEYYEIMGEKWKCLEMEICRTPEEGTVPEV